MLLQESLPFLVFGGRDRAKPDTRGDIVAGNTGPCKGITVATHLRPSDAYEAGKEPLTCRPHGIGHRPIRKPRCVERCRRDWHERGIDAEEQEWAGRERRVSGRWWKGGPPTKAAGTRLTVVGARYNI